VPKVGSGLVASVTRDKVLAAASQLSYTPNLLAVHSRKIRSATLGLVIHEFSNPFYSPMVSAIENYAAKRDILVILGESQRNALLEQRYVERFRQLRVAGIIITPTMRQSAHLDAFSGRACQFVVLARQSWRGDFVTVDNVAGGRLAARHILQRGHQVSCHCLCQRCREHGGAGAGHGFRRTLPSSGSSDAKRLGNSHTATSFEDGAVRRGSRAGAVSETIGYFLPLPIAWRWR